MNKPWMNKPWLHWSRRDFQKKILPLVTLNFLAYWVVLPLVSPAVVRIALGIVLVVISLGLGYVTFAWAFAYDRRNPPGDRG